MSSDSKVLVLVANEKSATLCSNSNGVTRQLRAINRIAHTDGSFDASASARHVYACELMMALSRNAREQDYDGVVIFADAAMMEELRGVQTNFISKMLIAEVVGAPSDPCVFPGASAGRAQMAYRAGAR
jgi:hypothetical protein